MNRFHQETPKADPWDALNIEQVAVDTGIPDLAENHDHYLYGLPNVFETRFHGYRSPDCHGEHERCVSP